MLATIVYITGGLIKDTVVTACKVYDTVVEEVSSIPEAFEQGYDSGILTAEKDDVVENITTTGREEESTDTELSELLEARWV